MTKWTTILLIITLFLILVNQVISFQTSSGNYNSEITIASSDNLNSTNYKTEVGLIQSDTLNSSNYSTKIGFYNLIRTDNIPPNLTLISPVNNTYYKSSDIPNIDFKYNVSDNIIVKNCTLFVGNIEKESQSSITQVTNVFQGHFLEFGTDMEWRIVCYDDSQNSVSAFNIYTFDKATETGGAYSEPEPATGGGFVITPLPKYNFTIDYLCRTLKDFIDDNTIDNIFGFDSFDLEELSFTIKAESENDIDIYTLSRYIENYEVYCIKGMENATPEIEKNETIFIPKINITINKTQVKDVILKSYFPFKFKIGNLNSTSQNFVDFVSILFPLGYDINSMDLYAVGFRIVTWLVIIAIVVGCIVGANIATIKTKINRFKEMLNKETMNRIREKLKIKKPPSE